MANTIDRFIHIGDALPDTAKVGNIFFLIDSVNGNKIYACKTANVWDEILSVGQGISAGTLIDPATGLYPTS